MLHVTTRSGFGKPHFLVSFPEFTRPCAIICMRRVTPCFVFEKTLLVLFPVFAKMVRLLYVIL
jgi:hypothetical protein